MRTDLPSSIQNTMHELNPDSLVTLYELHLMDGTSFYLSPQGEVTWQGVTYDEIPCHLSEVQQDADGKMNRPKFSVANPGGVFSAPVGQGALDYATLNRKRVLKADLDADLDFCIQEQHNVSRIVSVSQQLIVMELRGVLDAARFKLPARAYYPPEFPHVKLS